MLVIKNVINKKLAGKIRKSITKRLKPWAREGIEAGVD